MHGGGNGRLRLWHDDGRIYCEGQHGVDGLDGRDVGGEALCQVTLVEVARVAGSDPLERGGRGLWIVRQLSDEVIIDGAATGTTVTAILGTDGAEGSASS